MRKVVKQLNDERRKNDRVKVSLQATWEGVLTILKGEVVDLSTTGCFILTNDQVTVGELIRLEIQQPREGVLYLWAEVVYQMSEIGFGVRFTGADEAEMKRLEWLVKAELLRARRSESGLRAR
ncbi:MAG TPA: PilZ domain-containing protein [Pyrinomonadaceae bacterium]|nr:PilZ domain-containing protein [Pyrinomonadaceae bacterium]